jgi:hypothetical protein
MYVLFVSAPENLARLDELRLINERLALDPAIPAEERAGLVRDDHPLTWGLPAEAGAFSRGHVLETTPPRPDTDRRVLARFPERDLLSSGYIEHEEAIADSPAVVWVRKGKGQLALFAFSPQGRASTPATYKLLLNGLLLPPVE